MLRESIGTGGEPIDLDGLADPDCREIPGIAHSGALISLADGFVLGDEQALAAARDWLEAALGAAAVVDALAIAANFQRMVRIADATGIPSDDAMVVMAEDLTRSLGADRYRSAVNTPALSWLRRAKARFLAAPAFRRMIRRASGSR